ncbi:MAG: outer membrane beta-barrel protein [Planctomycetota bacterium]
MNFKKWTAGIAVLTLATAPVIAEDSLAQWSYDQMVTPVGCCDDGCCGDGCDCGDGCGCGCGVAGGGLLSGLGPGWIEGFSIAGTLGIDAIDVGGWTQFGGTSEPTLTASIGGASFNDTEDRINLHQQYFYVGKSADGSNGFDLGFRADFIYGIDAPDTQSFGNPANSFDNGGSFTRGDDNHGWAIPQLYGEVAVGDLSVIIGHFYTLVGYEVVTAPDNFFFSHALTQYNSEPFTHTGVLATYSGFENLTLYGGWTAGWDTGFDQVNSGNNFLGGFSASLSDAITLTYINTWGNFGDINQGEDDDYGHSIVVDVALTDNLNYVFQSDYKRVAGGATLDEDVGINQYLIYSYNDILSFGTRIEWWSDDTVSHYGYTSGVNIKLLDNLIMRPEFRQDWVPGLDFDEEIAACDMILTY